MTDKIIFRSRDRSIEDAKTPAEPDPLQDIFEREQFAAALYGTSEVLKIDGEGRVVLTDALKSHAAIADAVTFAGLGHKFQIWEPERFRAELAEATEKVRALKKQLSSRTAAEGPQGARG